MDGAGAQTDASNASNGAEAAGISHGDNVITHLAAEDAKHRVEVMDGIESHVDALHGHRNALGIETDVDTPENEAETISKP